MEKKGIKWICTYCVDNILVKIADPYFVGFCADKNIDCASKVVSKAYPEEPVGVLCTRNGRPAVIEYSEIDEERRYAKDESGRLIYNWAHIVLNNFSVDFVKKIVKNHLNELPFHIAKKKVTCINDKGETVVPDTINGWKLELFVFDVFPFAERMAALEVDRTEEFSPLKNAPGSGKDCPETCCNDLSRLHKRWIKDSGGAFRHGDNSTGLCEISPLLSYAGEGLEPLVKGKEFSLPLHLE
eukprot:TRINITY_DN2898_c0_g1_i1.p1 TRINITY_DN2898_c0_g1~~TRINITY_DN2898_c0_g1_i1.p1  ORF type:complete len:241 (+),score=43.00 TRINITY_DN2898_c0_g1_i1:160-882(+)